MKKLTSNIFVERSRIIHGNRYNYVDVAYKDMNTQVLIICPIHGQFRQRPRAHLSGQGCPRCAGVALKSQEEFISLACKVHSGYYDYSRLVYIGIKEKVKIICPKHGLFLQTAERHLLGQGCPECKRETLSWKTEDIIDKFNQVHNGKYMYYQSVYKGIDKKIAIICPKHGMFYQTPDSHLRGSGCPRCVSHVSRWEARLLDYVKERFPDAKSLRKWWPGHPQKEIDIYIPSLRIGFECDGVYWHGIKKPDTFMGKEAVAREQGIKLYQLRESTSELENKAIIDSFLRVGV